MISAKIILHDYFETADGGGRVSLRLASALDADLAFGFCAKDHPYFRGPVPDRIVDIGCVARRSLLKQISLARGFIRRSAFLADYDLAVYSGTYSPLAILGNRARRNVAYCHTPPRFVYDLREYYLQRLPLWQRPLLRAFIQWLRPRYERAMREMDQVICNSETVRARIGRFLSLDATVVYPSCDTKRLCWLGQRDYYLSVARHDDVKRVDLCIRAFLAMPDKKLVVLSGGTQQRRLRRLARAASNIRFLGEVTDQRLAELIGNAIATIYLPINEDFGLSPIESMAAGKPVLAVRSGGLTETILDGQTGVLLSPHPNVSEVIKGINRLSPAMALRMRAACERRAQRFSTEVFVDRITELLDGP